jgi:GT2 family glycosyltransferase
MDYQPKILDINQIKVRPILDDITIVIPTLGRPILEESLYWIVNGSAWPGELIIVDQSSSRQVEKWTEKLKSLGISAQYVPSAQRGKAAALNRGIELSETYFLVVTDDDCFVKGDWLKKMACYLHNAPDSVVTGPAEAIGEQESVAVVTINESITSHHPGLKFDLFCGSNMGIAKSVIKQIGLFDEDLRLIAAEDCEWAYRTLRSGVPIVYSPEIIVQHFSWRDVNQRDVRYRTYAHSMGGFYGKYLRQGDWFIALRAILHHLRALRRWVRGTITGDQEASLYGRAYVTGLLPGIIAGFRRAKTL